MIPKFADIHTATAGSGSDCDVNLTATPGYFWRVMFVHGGHDSVAAASYLSVIHDYIGTPEEKYICYVTSPGPLPMPLLFEGDVGKGVKVRLYDATSDKILAVTAVKVKVPS